MKGFTLVFNEAFFRDLELINNYYSEISAEVKNKFAHGVNVQIKLIKKTPFVKSIRYDDVRLAKIDRFSYAIHYSINEQDNVVEIHRLLSYYQSPDNWYKSGSQSDL